MKSRPEGRTSGGLSAIPSVTEVLAHPAIAAAADAPGSRGAVLAAVRAELDHVRSALRRAPAADEVDDIARAVVRRLAIDDRPMPRALKATGVVLHSGLGRAPLPPRAVAAVAQAAAGYSLLEVDRDAGRRRARDTRCASLIRSLSGADDALFVNNNAAAVMLAMNTLARGRSIVCSRGEMVEIGGSFRIPEVIESAGCELVAVGATNKTRIEDYESAIKEQCGALLVVHTSNYRIVGFTGHPRLADVCALGRARGVPVVHDLGSGSILGAADLGVGDEPAVAASLRAGADLVCMSGDKLLGGPQAGIILGRADLVSRCRNNPLARALRIDKLRVAAMEATLEVFLDGRALDRDHPVTGMLRATPDIVRDRAERLAAKIRDLAAAGLDVAVVPSAAEAGSGALPAVAIPSFAVALRHATAPPDAIARALRLEPIPLFAVVREGRVLLDARTLLDDELNEAAAVVAAALAGHV